MPSIRAMVDRKLVYNKMTPLNREMLSEALRFLVTNYLGEHDVKSVEMLWLPYAAASNAIPFSIDVLFTAPRNKKGEIKMPKGRTLKGLAEALKSFLALNPFLPKGIAVGVWIIPLTDTVWTEAIRESEQAHLTE